MKIMRQFHPLQWLSQAWQDLPLSLKGIFVIALPLAVLLTSLASLYSRELESTMLENKLKHALQNQRDIQTIHTQLMEASTGVRDYLLTGDKHFLKIFYDAEKMLPTIIGTLDERLESEQQRERLANISPLVAKNLAELKQLSNYEMSIASDELTALFKSQVDTLDKLRTKIETLNAEEALLVAEDQQKIFLQRQQNISATLLAAITGIIGSLMAVWIFSKTIVKRVRLLRDSAGHLARVEALELPSKSKDELGQLSNELEQASQLLTKTIGEAIDARKEAEEASASKSMFLSRTSHELRTPLNAILGFAQLLEEELPEGKQRDNAAMIRNAGQHLLRLINEVLEITRIESGETTLELTPTPINTLLEDATHFIAPIGKIRDIEIVCNIAANLWATANRQKLLQVVLNLLSNALKYGPVSSDVELSAYRKEANIVIEVLDSGAGIPQSLRERLFTAFDRLGAENTKIEGTGLGLALSRQIMQAMHGSIHVAADKSLFWIEIPACDPVAQVETTPSEPPQQLSKTIVANKHTILYVEDNVSNRALVEAIIQRHRNLRIQCVATIRDAKRRLHEITPALLLLDLNLPDGSGEDLVKFIKSTPALGHLPIMVLSADATPETVSRLNAAGVADYMTKPLDVAQFNKKIKELIRS